jgi:hypothetical protein
VEAEVQDIILAHPHPHNKKHQEMAVLVVAEKVVLMEQVEFQAVLTVMVFQVQPILAVVVEEQVQLAVLVVQESLSLKNHL